jgi:N-acetylglucosamine-6-sulfatase
MRRPLTLLSFAALLASAMAGLASPAQAAAQADRPSIVVVLTDDQRWDTLATMPTVQRELVQKGVTFANAFVVNPLCCPSRASLLTGLYSHSTGVYDNVPPYGAAAFDARSTVATWLARAGYRTAHVGKYLNGHPRSVVPPGWHRWVTIPSAYFDYWLWRDGVPTRFADDDASYSTDVLTREALSFIESSRDPFFLVYAPFAPHAPATPAPRHADAFADLEPWRAASHNELDIFDKPRWLQNRRVLTETDEQAADAFRRSQLASLLAVDEGVDDILDALDRSGRLENTIVVYTSDNGLLWGEHRMWNRKVVAFEESMRVPLVVRHDALVPWPRTETRLVTNIDLAPTLAELAGARAPRTDGASLVPLLGPAPSRTPSWRRSFLIEHLRGPAGASVAVPTYCAVRGERWKYVRYATREEELYDLASDPHELDNRAGDAAFLPQLFTLRSRVKDLCDPPPPGFDLSRLCTHEAEALAGTVRGTQWADNVCGSGAPDFVDALAGDDAVEARTGGDVVRAGKGADVVKGQSGADWIVGGPGSDRLHGGAGPDVIHARDGERDRVTCGLGRDVVRADATDRVAGDCETVRRPVAGSRR